MKTPNISAFADVGASLRLILNGSLGLQINCQARAQRLEANAVGLILAFRFDLLDLLPEIKASSQAK